MKKLLFILPVLMFAAACEHSRSDGECIGAFDDGDPALTYETSSRNVGVSVVSFIVPPVGLVTTAYVVAVNAKCPNGVRNR